MTGQPRDPVRRGLTITVEERDQVGGRCGQTGVPRGPRTAVDLTPDEPRSVPARRLRHCGLVAGGIVDHDHGVLAAQRRQAALEQVSAVMSGDDHGHCGSGRQGRWHRVGQPGVGEVPGQHARGSRGDLAGPQVPPGGLPGRAQPGDPHR